MRRRKEAPWAGDAANHLTRWGFLARSFHDPGHFSERRSPFNRSSAGQRRAGSSWTNGRFVAVASTNVGYLQRQVRLDGEPSFGKCFQKITAITRPRVHVAGDSRSPELLPGQHFPHRWRGSDRDGWSGQRGDCARGRSRLSVGSLVADVLVDVEVVLSGPGPRVVGPHGVGHELAELVWVGLP